jgi:hypothetical protein
MAEPVPPQVANAARSLDLGELHGVYPGPVNVLWLLMWWGYAFMVGGSGFAVLGGTLASRAIWIPAGVILLACAAWMVWRGVQIIANRKLYLYPGGIVYTHPSGRAKWYGTWEDTQVYWGMGNARGAENHRIVFPQGGKIKWGGFVSGNPEVRARQVGPQARMLSAARKTPLALERLRAGETLEFGPLLVDVQGVIYRDKELRWSQVASVTVYGRYSLIFAGKKKRGFRVSLFKIPDLNVLLKVIEAARSF